MLLFCRGNSWNRGEEVGCRGKAGGPEGVSPVFLDDVWSAGQERGVSLEQVALLFL